MNMKFATLAVLGTLGLMAAAPEGPGFEARFDHYAVTPGSPS